MRDPFSSHSRGPQGVGQQGARAQQVLRAELERAPMVGDRGRSRADRGGRGRVDGVVPVAWPPVPDALPDLTVARRARPRCRSHRRWWHPSVVHQDDDLGAWVCRCQSPSLPETSSTTGNARLTRKDRRLLCQRTEREARSPCGEPDGYLPPPRAHLRCAVITKLGDEGPTTTRAGRSPRRGGRPENQERRVRRRPTCELRAPAGRPAAGAHVAGPCALHHVAAAVAEGGVALPGAGERGVRLARPRRPFSCGRSRRAG